MRKIRDLSYLKWSYIRKSSGIAGSFLKAYDDRGPQKIYYKLSNYEPGTGIVGHECFNELIVDRLLTCLDIPHLPYELIHAKIEIDDEPLETWICASVDFKTIGDSKIALDTFYELESNKGEKPLDFCIRKGFEEYIYTMMAVDFIILNRDRHGANIEILKNRINHSIVPAPLFDHGLSLILENDIKEIEAFDITSSRKVQCFLGGNDPQYNLSLLDSSKLPAIRRLTEADRIFIFDGLSEGLPDILITKTWEMLNYRWEQYENIRNKK